MPPSTFTPDFSELFETWTDPESGVVSHLLEPRLAPVQHNFYFVNCALSPDARWLWFCCAFPPSPAKSLGVADLQQQTMRHFPETQYTGESPMVDARTGGVFWTAGAALWYRGPQPSDPVQQVNVMPEELVGERLLHRLATHLTLTADGRAFFIDARVGTGRTLLGTLPRDGGDFQLWAEARTNFNHGQASPTDPDLAMVAWDHENDVDTGKRVAYEDRLWLVRPGAEPRPVFPEPTLVTHEWWDADGRHVWFVSSERGFGEGTWRLNLQSLEAKRMAPWFWHADDWNHGQYLVGDRHSGRFYRGCPSSVHFVNVPTGREVTLISHNPEFLTPGRQYHIDPHPRFSACGRYVLHTTTVRGRADLALTEVAPLIERTA